MNVKLVVLLLMAISASAQSRILVHGHRGARAVLPENTIPAFEYAIAAGADMLELDLAVTKDDVLVVSHDPVVNRKICAGPEGETRIRFLTLAEVKAFDCGARANPEFPKQKAAPGTRIPTLDEVLALAAKRAGFGFNIEIKSDPRKPELQPEPAEFAKLVVDAIRRHKAEKRVMVQSFDFRTVVAVRAIAPDLKLCALYGGMPKDFSAISQEAGGTPIVAPNFAIVSREAVDKAHDAGLQVIPWTANTADVWDRLIEAGVNAIITDDPAALIAHLRAKRLH
ncbi:MAG TPA: glycerophosphodiester phosphodiesterase [Bryobacteraceae bacterium]|nr:glycerophosphodiester phosphodiesterase [Bryobacteraceae bacterium]